MRVVTVAWLVLAPDLPTPVAGTDAAAAKWESADALLDAGRLAFDHAAILTDGVERARSKLEYSSLAASFCPENSLSANCAPCTRPCGVSISTQETSTEKSPAPRAFSSKRVRPQRRGGGRPAMLYRARDAVLNPPILRG